MAAPVKERRNTPYTGRYDTYKRQGSRYDYKSSNAYDYAHTYTQTPAALPKRRPQRQGSAVRTADRAVRPNNPRAAQKAAWKVSKKKFVGSVLKIAAVFVVGCTLIYRNAMILEANQKISNMEAQYNNLLSQNQAISTQIEQSVELGALEEKATEELGMMKPDASQVFYIDMGMGDGVENNEENQNNADGTDSVLKGTPGALVHAFQVLK